MNIKRIDHLSFSSLISGFCSPFVFLFHFFFVRCLILCEGFSSELVHDYWSSFARIVIVGGSNHYTWFYNLVINNKKKQK